MYDLDKNLLYSIMDDIYMEVNDNTYDIYI